MIKNYFKIALRNIQKRKVFTTIHIFGLGVAFSAAIILFLTAMYELSYDDFHTKLNRIGTLYDSSNPVSGKDEGTAMPIPMAPTLLQEVASVESATRVGENPTTIRYGEKTFSPTTYYVDPSFFEVFDFPLAKGSKGTALAGLDDVVITENMANSLFGKEEAVGKQIEVNQGGQWESRMVSAVLAKIPSNSSVRMGVLMRFEHFFAYERDKDKWNNNTHNVYVLRQENTSWDQLNTQLRPFTQKHFANSVEDLKRDGAQPDKLGDYYSLRVFPFAQYHFSPLGGSVSVLYPWMLLLLSGLILFIAGSNFVNLTLADSFSRSKEIGMRKTLGSGSRQLILQFWGESALICMISILVGLGLAWILLPQYNALMRYELQLFTLFNAKNFGFFALVFLFITVVAGGYPAWIMARFNTIQILKGKLNLNSGNSLKQVLTVAQFAIAILLITGTIIIGKQIHYLQSKPLGYNKAEVISIPVGQHMDGELALQRMRQALNGRPEVLSVSGTDINMGRGRDGSSSTSRLGFEYEGRNVRSHLLRVDYDYLKTMDMQLLEGRDFSTSFATDVYAVIINEQMDQQLGSHSLGKTLPIRMGADNDSIPNAQIIGIVKDFNFKSLYQAIEPLSLFINPEESPIQYIFVRVRPRNLQASIQSIEAIWKGINPKATDEASYLDENTNNEYRKEQRFASIITSGATLATVISCMGLFALALLMINRRVKEIGIRKVLGASVGSVMLLLSASFVKMVLIAFAIAAPIVWWAASDWMEGFAYHIELQVWMFLAGGLLVLGIALLTVSVQSLRAAMANPVESLRDE
ncbi:ABC transporter permease [Olivibacter sitiensis]|uniref:ABC transporter permease n=1 Tax=Olivibacter sitiensis TaxID=376470 RepID=UPI00041DF13F|nr:ABC transporter permease [Olivibacter sitiensis]